MLKSRAYWFQLALDSVLRQASQTAGNKYPDQLKDYQPTLFYRVSWVRYFQTHNLYLTEATIITAFKCTFNAVFVLQLIF
jgi:hypothetical protein